MQLGGVEIILILALLVILFGAKKLPEIAKGLGQGLFEFRKAIDDEATEAGRSLGGIYGKPAAQALTSDNQVAELYKPAALDKESLYAPRRNFFVRRLAKCRRLLLRFLRLPGHAA